MEPRSREFVKEGWRGWRSLLIPNGPFSPEDQEGFFINLLPRAEGHNFHMLSGNPVNDPKISHPKAVQPG